jgi:hypothetical protein
MLTGSSVGSKSTKERRDGCQPLVRIYADEGTLKGSTHLNIDSCVASAETSANVFDSTLCIEREEIRFQFDLRLESRCVSVR